MKRDEFDTLRTVVAICLLALLLSFLTGCKTTEGIRLDKDPNTLAGEATCAPLPLCDIPPAATSTQLESSLWACVLEYRALYSACYHLVHPLTAAPLADADTLEVF